MLLIIFGALMMVSLVILHELGHFIAARRSGIEVEEFGIGFPPRAKVITEKNGTVYTLNWLPLGGFVKLKGEHDTDTEKGSFGAAPLRAKIAVMVAGVVVNFLVAVLLLSVVAAVALPKFIDNQFVIERDSKIVEQSVVAGFVALDSPAASAIRNDGSKQAYPIEAGDSISRISAGECEDYSSECSYVISSPEDVRAATEALSFDTDRAPVVIEMQDESQQDAMVSVSTSLLSKEEVEASRQTEEPKGYLGIVPSEYLVRRSTWSAPIVATVVSGQIVQESFKGLATMVSDLFRGDTETASQSAVGVIGIGYFLGQISQQGFIAVLFLVSIISLSLAIMNILPIPALDGGRLFVTLVSRAIKKPLTQQMEERIHGTGFALLMLLFVLITILDVQRFIIG